MVCEVEILELSNNFATIKNVEKCFRKLLKPDNTNNLVPINKEIISRINFQVD